MYTRQDTFQKDLLKSMTLTPTPHAIKRFKQRISKVPTKKIKNFLRNVLWKNDYECEHHAKYVGRVRVVVSSEAVGKFTMIVDLNNNAIVTVYVEGEGEDLLD